MALLPSDPGNQKKLLIGVIPLLALFAYHQLAHGKRVEEAELLEDRLEQLTVTNNAAKILAQQGGPELERKLAIYEQHMRQLEELIPKREEVAELLYTVTLRVQSANVDLVGMKPEAQDPSSFYTRHIYEMGVRGTYHDIGVFLSDIGSLSRIVTPTQLKLTLPTQPESNREGEPLLDANFRIVTYVVPDAVTLPAEGEENVTTN
jgi:type IV pilus assembly protein PilO